MTEEGEQGDDLAARRRVEQHPLWYHTLELGPGLVTSGRFDLRSVVDRLPWPDCAGKRCLDVGSFDGFFSFELERRGAAEVIAIDVASPEEMDWAPRDGGQGAATVRRLGAEGLGSGFELAKELLGSSAQRVEVNAYDLSPERLGSFDVVICGSLLLHLRDPVRALEAIHSVCSGYFLASEAVSLRPSMLFRRRPVAEFHSGEHVRWWVPNRAGLAAEVECGGFDVTERTPIYSVPLGTGHPDYSRRSGLRGLGKRLLPGGEGVAHAAVLATA